MRRLKWSSLVLLLFLWMACGGPAEHGWQGTTMGTTYQVKFIAFNPDPDYLSGLREKVDAALVEVNRQMSTYEPKSEISQFNNYGAGVPFKVSPEFAKVVLKAQEISQDTDGAFDITVGPVVELWGFGAKGRRTQLPEVAAVEAARSRIGWQKITVVDDEHLQKSEDSVRIDLSAIAKGYGVDVVAEILQREKINDYLVEVGGEVRAFGRNLQGRPWLIGIERPDPETMPGSDFAEKLILQRVAVATSGDYRNFFTVDGKMYSHTINPVTGWPVEHFLASATVMASDCMTADGYATALMVLGAEKGMEWIESKKGVECLLIERMPDGTFVEHRSSGIERYLVPEE